MQSFVARIPSLITLIATLKFLWYHACVAIFVKSRVTAHLVKTIVICVVSIMAIAFQVSLFCTA